MKAKLTIQSLSFEFETNGGELPPNLGTMIMPALPTATVTPAAHLLEDTAAQELRTHILPPPQQTLKPRLATRKPAKPSPGLSSTDFAEKRARTGSPRWELFPTRTATKDFPDCYFCHETIHIHKHYRDGGQPHLRAHETCITARLARAKEAQL